MYSLDFFIVKLYSSDSAIIVFCTRFYDLYPNRDLAKFINISIKRRKVSHRIHNDDIKDSVILTEECTCTFH